jgi:hypothetical protein
VDQGGGCANPAEPLNAEGGVGNRLIDQRGGGVQDCEGLNAGEQWIRYASTMAWQETRDIGPAYDSDASVRDWSKWDPGAPGYFARFLPRNSTCPAVPVVTGRDPYQRADRLGNGHDAGYVTAFVNDGISYWVDGIKPTYYTGWTPSPMGFCSSCPRSNMFRYTDYDIPWWGRYEFTRVSTGNWTLGMYARRKTGPYDYGVSTQVLLNVTQNSDTRVILVSIRYGAAVARIKHAGIGATVVPETQIINTQLQNIARNRNDVLRGTDLFRHVIEQRLRVALHLNFRPFLVQQTYQPHTERRHHVHRADNNRDN